MQANFDKCLEYVLEHEGGYVDHPEDPGGRTNLGITQKVYEKYLGKSVTEEEMKELPLEHAKDIYKKGYWDKVCGDELPDGLDFSVFDWAVNSGPSRSAKALQKLVDVTPDGAIGPLTLAAVRTHSTSDLISEFSKERELFYRRLRTFSTFGKGWLNRLDKTQKQSYELLLDVPLTPV